MVLQNKYTLILLSLLMVFGATFTMQKKEVKQICIEDDEEVNFFVNVSELNKRLKNLPNFTLYSFNNKNSPATLNRADIVAQETVGLEVKKDDALKKLGQQLKKYKRLMASRINANTKEDKEHFINAEKKASDVTVLINKIEELENGKAHYDKFVHQGKMIIVDTQTC